MADPKPGDALPRAVDHEEFVRDPGAVVARAAADGPVAITEDDKPIMYILRPHGRQDRSYRLTS